MDLFQHYLVLRNLQHSIQLKNRFYSPLVEHIVTSSLPTVLGSDLEELIILHLWKQRKEHLIMLVLVKLILFPENQYGLKIPMRNIQKLTTSVHSSHQLILTTV
ncbi:MAG: hypothetical protein CMN91_12170 [Synechococcus sp. ARS1019]|nr:hypothetical protein [Synechococcus sp. ARS1019]